MVELDIKTFLGFLKDEGVFIQYKHNYINARRTNILYDLKNLNDKTSLTIAFDWKNTKEGFSFWNEIDTKWLTYLFLYKQIKK